MSLSQNFCNFVDCKQEDSQMQDWAERTYLLIGQQAAEALADAHVVIVGVGGVGAYAA